MRLLSSLLLSLSILLALSFALSPQGTHAEDPVLDRGEVSESSRVMLTRARDRFVVALKSSGKSRLAGLSESYETLRRAVKEDPTLPPARTMWAKMLLSAGDERLARRSLQQAITEAPDDPEAYLLLANLAVRSSQLAEAELAFKAAEQRLDDAAINDGRQVGIRAQIASGLATIAQARSLFATQAERAELASQYDEQALTHLKRFVAVAPESASAHERLAVALLKQGDREGAVASFDRARDLDPTLPVTDLRLARSFLATGKREMAGDALQRAVKEHPQDLTVLTSAAELAMVMGDQVSAADWIDRSLQLNPEALSVNRLQAQRLRFEGNTPDAAETLQRLNSEHPADFETAVLLALTLTDVGDENALRRAISVATVTSQRFDVGTREGRRARIALAWAAHVAGQTEAAKKVLNQILATGIQSNEVSGDEAYILARLLVEFGRPELAAPLLKSVLGRGGSFPRRAEAEMLLGQLK